MTQLQKTKVNRALGLGQDPDKYLSQRQLAILKDMDLNKADHRESDITEVWYSK